MRIGYISAILFILALFSAPAHASVTELVLPDLPYTHPLIPNECALKDDVDDAQQCHRLDHGMYDVLFLERGLCRWMDNSSASNDYLVPFNTQMELDHFFTSATGLSVMVDECCVSTRKIVGTLADGRQVAVTTPVGRSYSIAGATTPYNHISQQFSVGIPQGTCLATQTVDVTAACNGSGWNISAKINDPTGCTPPPVTPDPPVTPPPVTPPPVTPPPVCVTKKPVDLALVVDASNSMQGLVDSVRNSTNAIVNTYLAGHDNIKLSVFIVGGSGYGNQSYNSQGLGGRLLLGTCNYGMLTPPAEANADGLKALLAGVKAANNTPLAATINYAGQSLDATRNPTMIVLTDGVETCNGDVNGAVNAQKNKGTKVLGVAYGSGTQNFGSYDSTIRATSQTDILNALSQYMNDSVSCAATQ